MIDPRSPDGNPGLRANAARYDEVTMKRWALRIAIFLILGAIVNVAVAWSICARISHDARWPTVTDVIPTAEWQKWYERHFPFRESHDTPIRYQAIDSLRSSSSGGFNLWRLKTFSKHDEAFPHIEVARLLSGLPIRGMSGAMWTGRRSDRSGLPTEYVAQGLWFGDSYCLLLQPIWPGFAINTVFYAAVLWGLFIMPFALRKRRRTKRGLCPKCAYDLRGAASEACPECGRAIGS